MKTSQRRRYAFAWLLLAGCFVGCANRARKTPFVALDYASSDGGTSFTSSVDEHARRGAAIRNAVERGDLEGTHREARALEELVMRNERPAPDTALGEMLEATRKLESTPDLVASGKEFAVLTERCGQCHGAIEGPLSIPEVPPADELAIMPRMRRHQWAAARLWEGLVAPSDEAWASGATVLTDAPLIAEVPADGKTGIPTFASLAASVHEIGIQAALETSTSKRVEIYGRLLGTCASCHAQNGGGPK